jgi:hypothetical protein
MKKNLIIYLTIIGILGLFTACEKDGDKVVMLASPIAPSITTLPDLTLKRVNGTNTLEFIGTPVDPGFHASATYFLEVCATGNNFKDSLVIVSSVQDTSLKISVSDLNGILLKKFPADQASSLDFRIRSVLVIDAGTGYKSMIYSSAAQTASVTIYGLPRLDLVNSGVTQKIESALGDGKYTGYVKLDPTKLFTLKDPDANITYGANGAALKVGGTGITAGAAGWHKLNADTKALTYSMDAYMIGLIGSATSNGWNTPDQKMDYDAKAGTWNITVTLVDGEIKFRLNDGWAWNLGGTTTNLTQGGNNIAVTAGNYTIALTIINGTTGTFKIVKN